MSAAAQGPVEISGRPPFNATPDRDLAVVGVLSRRLITSFSCYLHVRVVSAHGKRCGTCSSKKVSLAKTSRSPRYQLEC